MVTGSESLLGAGFEPFAEHRMDAFDIDGIPSLDPLPDLVHRRLARIQLLQLVQRGERCCPIAQRRFRDRESTAHTSSGDCVRERAPGANVPARTARSDWRSLLPKGTGARTAGRAGRPLEPSDQLVRPLSPAAAACRSAGRRARAASPPPRRRRPQRDRVGGPLDVRSDSRGELVAPAAPRNAKAGAPSAGISRNQSIEPCTNQCVKTSTAAAPTVTARGSIPAPAERRRARNR